MKILNIFIKHNVIDFFENINVFLMIKVLFLNIFFDKNNSYLTFNKNVRIKDK